MSTVSGHVAVRAASVPLRLLGGMLDLCLFVGGFVAYLVFVEHHSFGNLPPRYWNYLDYVVDLMVAFDLKPLLIKGFAGYVLFEVFFGLIMRNTPFCRLFGMRFVTASGKRPLLFRLFFKTLFQILFSFAGLFGILFSLIHPEKRMLHDCLSGCYCVMEDVKASSLINDADTLKS